MKFKFFLYFLITITSLFTGCASGTREISLRNSEINNIKTGNIPRAHNICLNRITDARPDTIIGHLLSSSGNQTAEITATNNVSNWIGTETRNRLISAGYTVNKCGMPDTSSLIVNCRIIKTNATANSICVGNIELGFSVLLKNAVLLDKKYSVLHNGSRKSGVTDNSFRVILEESLEITLSGFIDDINRLDISPEPIFKPASVQNKINAVDKSAVNLSTAEKTVSDSDNSEYSMENGEIKVISGKRNAANISTVTDNVTSRITSFYKSRLKEDPSLSGNICLYFEISNDGKVQNISVIRNTLNDKTVLDELIKMVSTCRFAHINNTDEITKVKYNSSFRNKPYKRPLNAMGPVLSFLCIIFATVVLITTR